MHTAAGEWMVQEEMKNIKGHICVHEFMFGELDELQVFMNEFTYISACLLFIYLYDLTFYSVINYVIKPASILVKFKDGC